MLEEIKMFNYVMAVIFCLCFGYQLLYFLMPFLKRSEKHRKTELHRYAVLISARNEEHVITQLVESIKAQDYPSELVDIYVVADNCTDATAELARRAGAIVYERFNRTQVGKGYAMDYLLHRIQEERGDCYDGFFVFDADNVLAENYITEMNKTFSDGYRIVTSYRNSKNYGDNWITAGYSLWFLRESKYLNNARMLLHTSCAVSGTGFLFSREILKRCGGWRFFLLTEDIQFTVHNVVNGEKIGYCKDAVLYDEQPTTFYQSWNQRMRWAKGNLQVFWHYRRPLLKGLLLHGNFACFDMTVTIMLTTMLTLISVFGNVLGAAALLLDGYSLLVLKSLVEFVPGAYLMVFVMGALTTVTEWNNIYCAKWKKILYMFTFPLFMFTYLPISMAALVKKVEWKPIVHNRVRTLDEIRGVQRTGSRVS